VAPGARIPVPLDGVVLRALAKKPAERFQTARELRQALERGARGYADAGVSGLESTMMAPSSPALRASSVRRPRSRLIPFAIVVAAAALLIGNHLRPKVFGRRGSPSVASEPARRPHVAAGSDAPVPEPAHDNPKRTAPEAAREPPPETKPAVKREPSAGTKPAVKRTSSAATKPAVKHASSAGTKHVVKRTSSKKTKQAAKRTHTKSKKKPVRKRKS